MKVRVNSIYRYSPNGWDTLLATSNNSLILGQVVRVINLPSAPKANTMGQCYVANPITGKFICMVSTGSLTPLTSTQKDVFKWLSSKRKSSDAPIFVSENEASIDPIVNGVI